MKSIGEAQHSMMLEPTIVIKFLMMYCKQFLGNTVIFVILPILSCEYIKECSDLI